MTVTKKAASASRRPRSRIPATPSTRAHPKTVTFANKSWRVNKVFLEFFQFVYKRHCIFEKRLAREEPPWTDDRFLAKYPFTNVFRVLDRNSQYILHDVIGEGPQTRDEMFFRVLLFRTFNKVGTWELLKAAFGTPTYAAFDVEAYEQVLSEADCALYSPAYIIPAPQIGYASNLANHLRFIDALMESGLPEELTRVEHLKDAHGRLLLWPSMGEFTAMQLLLDVNMIPGYNWSQDEWVALGPGSTACLDKMFGDGIRPHALDAIRYIRDNQYTWFSWAGVDAQDIPALPGQARGLTIVDIEHALCECEKYTRGVFPELSGKRKMVGKHEFKPNENPVTADVPAHWRGPRPTLTYAYNGPVGEDDVYEVSHIVSERKGGEEFEVRWAGWELDEDSVLKRAELEEGSAQLVRDWDKFKVRIQKALEVRWGPKKYPAKFPSKLSKGARNGRGRASI